MKTRSYIVMLALVCLTVMSVSSATGNAAEEGAKKDVNEPKIVVQATAEKAEIFKTEMEKVSYIIGTQIARQFKSQEIEINLDTLLMGLKDALGGNKLVLSQNEMNTVYKAWQGKMRAKQAAKKAKEAAENLAAGTAFLKANEAKEGVKVLPSGLQYKVIKEGTGNTPTADDKVKTHYRGTLIDGTEFDSSYKRNRPAEFPVKGVIKGWTEALQLMKEGGKWELYIPATLAYGERGRPGIPPNSTLIFDIELLEIVKPAEPTKPAKTVKPAETVKPTKTVKPAETVKKEAAKRDEKASDGVYYSDVTDPNLGIAKNIVVEQAPEGMRVSGSGVSVQALIKANSFEIKTEPEDTEIEITTPVFESHSGFGVFIGKVNIKLGKDSTLPAKIPLQGTSLIVPNVRKLYGFVPGASGSQNVSVKINKAVGYTDVAGLRFKQEVILNILEDGAVELRKEGVVAVDMDGNEWISKKTKHGEQTAIIMVKKK